MAKSAADKGERALEEVGADESVVGAEAVEDDGGFARAEAGGIVFANAWAAATCEGANGGGPVDLFCAVAGTVGAEAARLAGGIARLMTFAIPGVVEFSVGEEFFGDDGFWEDEDFLGDDRFFCEAEKIEGKG